LGQDGTRRFRGVWWARGGATTSRSWWHSFTRRSRTPWLWQYCISV